MNSSVCALVFALTIGSLASSCSERSSTAASGGTETNTSSATPTNAAAAKTSPEFEALKGKWERPDGGYVLEIRSVKPDGKMEASYFNPSPINISRAVTYREGTKRIVFVELNDENYPGCTYKLTFDPQHDQLFGQYYQATMQQTFDVTFAHLK